MSTTSGRERWILEVVRGRNVGRCYQVGTGETPIGNALAGAQGFDLADQESDSPRRMAGRHACITAAGDALSIRDLESPGGTFVNRQRLLAGQARPLQPGDLIQLGGVQLEVKREGQLEAQTPRPAQPQPLPLPQVQPRPAALSIPFTIPGGSTCKTWDDFLILAAQRWALVRDELTSGRLAEHLRRIGRTDLVPRPEPTQSADEQLDAWLARLPASRSSDPELDVHPQTLVIRATSAGGLIRKSLRITNVGYRLLRSTVRVEPAASMSIRVAAEFSARPFLTIDHTDIPVEIELPENARSTTLGTVVVESNGGIRRIEILLERPALNTATAEGLNGSGPVDLVIDTRPLGELIAAQPVARRLILVVTAASQQEFPRIAVQFEVHQPDGSFLLDATREDFRVTEERSPSSRRHASSGANLPSRQQSSRRDRRIHPRHGRPRGRLVALVPRPAHGARGPGASSLVAEPRQACVGAGHSTPGRLLHAGIAS